jgi:sensor histidine kinase YesM
MGSKGTATIDRTGQSVEKPNEWRKTDRNRFRFAASYTMNSFLYRHRVILLHLSFWSVYLSFFVYQVSNFRGEQQDLKEIVTRVGVHMFFNLSIAYLNYFIFLPRFLKNRNVGRYLVEFFIPFILLITARVHLQRYIVDGYEHRIHFFYGTFFIVQAVLSTLFIVIFVGMLRFAKDWFELEARRRELENEKLSAELSFLKEQINPHFLFNTLNNLYYLAYSKSENTTEVIAKLSQMMRYMIYESNYPKVPLSKEIEYMQNYVSLERLRLDDQTPIDFKVEGDASMVKVAPLILITFLENAFKHGVSRNQAGAWVNLSIKVDGANCYYKVENSKPTNLNGEPAGKSGIGLLNVKRRLELSYPAKYDLTVKDEPTRYLVQLNLSLV